MAGFFYRKHMLGLTTGACAEFIIANSQTITVGDSIKLSSGYATLALAAGPTMGVVLGIVDPNGINIDGEAADVDGTVSGSGQTLTYVAASDNATSKMVKVQVMCDPFALFYNDADGSLTQAYVGTFFDVVAASDQIDQSSTTTSGNWQLIELDPDGDSDASKGLFRIAEWQGWAYAQQ